MATNLIELPADARSDEITLQVVECSKCGFKGIAVYEESRRGALDQDSFSHTGYEITNQDLDEIRRLIRSCPDSNNSRCACPAHKKLGEKDSQAYWTGIKNISKSDSFRMDL
jgi:hypothetical protein